MIVQSKNQPLWFTKVGPTVYLRICQIERQVFTVEDDQKAVQHISAQEGIGAVCCNAAHGYEDNTFQGEPNIINRTLCVSTVVTACPNAALSTDSERYNKPFRNNGDISARIHLAPNAGTFIRSHRICDGYVCDGSRRIKGAVVSRHSQRTTSGEGTS
jgi:hypothetical protein